MCERRGYKELIWSGSTALSKDELVCVSLIEIGTDLENTTSEGQIKIFVLFDFLPMKKALQKLLVEGEFWSHYDFLYDPFSQGVPMKLMKSPGKDRTMEPKILSSDIIARYLGAKEGDVLEVLKTDRNPVTCTYRIVI